MKPINGRPQAIWDESQVEAPLIEAASGLLLEWEVVDFLAWMTTKIALFRSEGSERMELRALAEMVRRMSARLDGLLGEGP